MKKQAARAFLSCATASFLLAGHALARDLTFAERVAAQEAIERVYYAHQVGATAPFEAAFSREDLERKVRDYLERSSALEWSGRGAITPAMLREEARRMTASSAMPERLREIRAALGNDALLFEECVARPALAFRLSADSPAPPLSESLCIADDTWNNGSLASGSPLPGRGELTSVWTGNVVILWGGRVFRTSYYDYLSSGGMYDPTLDTWKLTSTNGAPSGRSGHTAVWTGAEMIVWGGRNDSPASLSTGGRYNPLTDTWTATSQVDAPAPRNGHAGVWTGSRMIVWGGVSGFSSSTNLNSGGRYDPSTDSWTATSTVGAPAAGLAGLYFWTGQEMLIWRSEPRVGARYKPSTDTWQPMTSVGSPSSRVNEGAVWTGSLMVVFGGQGGPTFGSSVNTGGRYDPSSDTWTQTSTANVGRRQNYSTVWTGHEMLVWHGFDYGVAVLDDGARYNPVLDTWQPMSNLGAPPGGGLVAWTGSFAMVWGSGASEGGRYALGHTIDDDGDGFSECGGDCNDGNAAVNPAASQVCNEFDNDCDGVVDFDNDLDGFLSCRDDCNDANPSVHPGAVETCDGLDNDCDGSVDDGVEICNGVDDDCDGSVDEDPAPPLPIHALVLPTETTLTWQPYAYGESSDIVKGSLAALRVGGGDFTSSVLGCLQNDATTATATDAASTGPGEGFYYLVRGRQCAIDGTYDEGVPEQAGSRDAEIAASGAPCP